MKRFKTKMRLFVACENGAVTVDWVVLTAAVIGLVFVAMAGLRGNMATVGTRAGEVVSNMTIDTSL